MTATHSSAFISLFSVLIVSALLLAAVTAGDMAVLTLHQAVVDEEQYRRAQEAAWTCATFAFDRLRFDSDRFSVDQVVRIDLDNASHCSIITAHLQDMYAEVTAAGENGRSNVEIIFKAEQREPAGVFSITSWSQD